MAVCWTGGRGNTGHLCSASSCGKRGGDSQRRRGQWRAVPKSAGQQCSWGVKEAHVGHQARPPPIGFCHNPELAVSPLRRCVGMLPGRHPAAARPLSRPAVTRAGQHRDIPARFLHIQRAPRRQRVAAGQVRYQRYMPPTERPLRPAVQPARTWCNQLNRHLPAWLRPR